MPLNHFHEFERKMREAAMGESVIRAFHHGYTSLLDGRTGMVPESSIQPVINLPRLDAQTSLQPSDKDLLAKTVILKLNGGLGTSMGLDSPKSLLVVKANHCFLDIIARQILHLRQNSDLHLHFLLMNSLGTSAPTLNWLKQHPSLGKPEDIELMQSSIPKVDAATLTPAQWPAQPELEWCPPGHGDLYPSLLGSGWLERLLDQGTRFLFVSNADNLGATLDGSLLQHFADSGKPFLMEVCERSAADRKGGHLAMRDGQLLLREAAQCPEADQRAFQDVSRHRFFNTNNLWLRLDRLKEMLESQGGLMPLPVIQNFKTVDPRNSSSPRVIQLETAMGAAIECFEDAGAIVVPRTRFAPVKTTADLLAVRSDAFVLTTDSRIVLDPARNGVPPSIELDARYYKMVDQLDASLTGGAPSLKECAALRIEGAIEFHAENVICGKVTVINPDSSPALLPPGVYKDTTVHL